MQINNEKVIDTTKIDEAIFAALFLIALFFVVDSSYSPLGITKMYVDSSVYMTIVQGMARGMLPYRDLVDNKGPLEYLISLPGFTLARFTGVWFTELLLMFVSVFFAYKIALFFANKYLALLGTAYVFAITYPFFYVNAGTEEYSLPFLMISLYVFTKFYFGKNRGAIIRNISFIELIVLGICFSSAVLIRLNMFPLWLGFCAVIFIEASAQKRFPALGKYVAGFCIGMLLVCVPVFLYLKTNGLLEMFFVQVVQGGAKRGFSGIGIKEFLKNFYVTLNRSFSFVPLFYGAFRVITGYKKQDFVYYVAYTFSYLLMVLFLSFTSGDSHYNMVLIPFYIPAFSFLTCRLYYTFSNQKNKRLCFALFVCIFC
jgi:hypothetical protein